jgi:hypothetical protein
MCELDKSIYYWWEYQLKRFAGKAEGDLAGSRKIK